MASCVPLTASILWVNLNSRRALRRQDRTQPQLFTNLDSQFNSSMKIKFPKIPAFILLIALRALPANAQPPLPAGQAERAYYVQALTRIADPVLTALSKNELRKQMPVEASAKGRESFTYLEAFGRLLAGMAPWLELGPDQTPEGRLRERYIKLTLLCLHNATDP